MGLPCITNNTAHHVDTYSEACATSARTDSANTHSSGCR